jgi:uncharacterized Ntn-hydrolase superfamily protein
LLDFKGPESNTLRVFPSWSRGVSLRKAILSGAMPDFVLQFRWNVNKGIWKMTRLPLLRLVPRLLALPLLLLSPLLAAELSAQAWDPDLLSTYSIIARDPATGELGLGVQSKAFAGGNRVVTAKGGLGIIAHQAVSNPMFGQVGLELLEKGMTPQDALDYMVRADNGALRRQVAILDMQGRFAAWSGPDCTDWKGHYCTAEYCAQGNTLAGPQVLDAMKQTFETSRGPLAERIMDALDAAQKAGGDWRGMQSAAILIVKPLAGASGFSDRYIDIRVDDNREPLPELRRLLSLARSGQLITETNMLLTQNKLDEALAKATAARDKAPEYDNAWVALASVYVRTNRKPDAVSALKRAAALNPANKVNLPKNPLFEALHKELNITY